jgi:competence protein ComEA
MGILNDYFSFSKRERTGAIVLIILVVIIFLLPEFFPPSKSSLDTNTIAEFRKQTSELRLNSSDSTTLVSDINPYVKAGEHKKTSLFYFDPNTVSEYGWKKLGINDRTIETIQKYILKGGAFKKAEDIGKIYGLRKDQYEQLLPYVRIVQGNDHRLKKEEYATQQNHTQQKNHKNEKSTPIIIDLNEADTSMLIALPGIGSKLARRILNFREKLGGFYSVEQIKEIYGLPDSTFQKIKSTLKCDSSQINKIDINKADAAALKIHPYIKWNIANAIVNYRQQHGNYDDLENLLQIDIISPETFHKLSPYLKVD